MNNMLIGIVLGVLLLCAGAWEAFAMHKNIGFNKTHASKETSPFLLGSYWMELVFSIVFIVGGIVMLIGSVIA
ncbi:hypothetical protein OZX69_02290 [Lactobacillus sp. ESL0731]|uniref:hypothetical protein n=1 Tax=unclassified Lactobacillus TaxID=2620435 RepID=UPI0023F8F8EB|nr:MULTISPECIES: hypothetical protein [unclassified Lactobacillus]WEV51543.1 hypothetical protein OZX63_02290 [Lactobacillus sp. ESL0700]WEV62671.1 hypothetical protein OZX69_02290 [Lactobacillus sp. ESL0731]